jgi:hypothetical protein
MDMRRKVISSLFHRALPLWLIAVSLSCFVERQCFSQVIGSLPTNAFLSAQNEAPAHSPSEVVKRYWKASAEGKFSETRQYIDPRLFDPKHSGEEEIQNLIKILTQLVPHSIYNDPMLHNKPGELVIGAIDEESVKDDIASVITITHFRGRPIVRSRFILSRREGEWKIRSVELDFRGVDDLIKKNDIRKIAIRQCTKLNS